MDTRPNTPPHQRRLSDPHIHSRVKAHRSNTTSKLGFEFVSDEATLRLPVQESETGVVAEPTPPPLWSVDLQVMIPTAPATDGPFFVIQHGAATSAEAALTLSLKDSRVAVSLSTLGRRFEIFRDPRAFSIGTWQRFKLALRFGTERYGLAQLLHDDVLIANYSGALCAAQ